MENETFLYEPDIRLCYLHSSETAILELVRKTRTEWQYSTYCVDTILLVFTADASVLSVRCSMFIMWSVDDDLSSRWSS